MLDRVLTSFWFLMIVSLLISIGAFAVCPFMADERVWVNLSMGSLMVAVLSVVMIAVLD